MEESPKIHKKIGDFFLTDKEIGRGSFGGVFLGYAAKDTSFQVAIKVLQIMDKDQEEIDKCNSEIKILTTLNHPNLVKFMGSVNTKEHLYMIFEFCKDGNLASYCKNIKKRNPYASSDRPALTEVQAINFYKQIVSGYFDLFQHNIIHRDLKPENIFIHAGCLKIGDFGLAKQFEKKDQAKLIETKCGTPLYMAPEINIKQGYNSYCDMWSLGVIFYEMMYGKTPWSGNSEYHLLMNIQKEPLIFPNNIPRNEKVKEILMKTLEVEPSKRMKWADFFKSVEDLEEDKSVTYVTGNLIHKNIKILKEDNLEEFKDLNVNDSNSKKGKTPYGGVSIIDDDFDKLLGHNAKKQGEMYEKIQNGRDYIFYHRNVSALIRKTNGILVDLYRTHILSISNDLFYKLIFILQEASHLILKGLLTVCNARFIENQDLSLVFFDSQEFKQALKELEEDFSSSEVEMKNTEEMVNETIQKWLNNDNDIIKNIEFISLVRGDDNKEMSAYFKEWYENTIKIFLVEQFDLLKEGLIEEKEVLKLLRYIQICSKIDGIYKILPRISGEDNSHLFFSLYDYLDNSTKEELLTLLMLAMKNKA